MQDNPLLSVKQHQQLQVGGRERGRERERERGRGMNRGRERERGGRRRGGVGGEGKKKVEGGNAVGWVVWGAIC